MAKPTVVSSSGKVLITGGYLVLDNKYSGTVISTSSRFYTVVQNDESGRENHIRVRSPQFTDATWGYNVSTTGQTVSVENMSTNLSKNKFVHLALQSTLAVASEINGTASVNATLAKGIDIAIVGDNDFYSQREKLAELQLPRTLQSLQQIPSFNHTGVHLSKVHKTGLGSSAALITSLVSALLLHFSVVEISSFENTTSQHEGRLLAHNLSQYVHCLAQGKVGSGFDVAAAVFGSHIYTRFDPAVLNGLMMDEGTLPSQALVPILAPSNKAWDYAVKPFKLPPLTRIMLADVDAGSDTPSLVGRVLKWRKENPEEALKLWTAIDELNTKLAQTLLELAKLYDADTENYISSVKYIASLQSFQWTANPTQPDEERPIMSTFYDVHEISQQIRANMRLMGKLSGVPIEPPEQTKLLDECISFPGVIGGGVPGAGGYDAIWLLVCDPLETKPDISPRERIELAWGEYKDLNVSPLSVEESHAGGARVEDLASVPGLMEATRLT